MNKTRLTDEILDAIEKAVAFFESDGEAFDVSDADEENMPAVREWVEAVRAQRGMEKQANALAPRLRVKR